MIFSRGTETKIDVRSADLFDIRPSSYNTVLANSDLRWTETFDNAAILMGIFVEQGLRDSVMLEHLKAGNIEHLLSPVPLGMFPHIVPRVPGSNERVLIHGGCEYINPFRIVFMPGMCIELMFRNQCELTKTTRVELEFLVPHV